MKIKASLPIAAVLITAIGGIALLLSQLLFAVGQAGLVLGLITAAIAWGWSKYAKTAKQALNELKEGVDTIKSNHDDHTQPPPTRFRENGFNE